MATAKKSTFGFHVGDWVGYSYRGAHPRGKIMSIHPGTTRSNAYAMIKPDRADNHSNHGESAQVKHFLSALHHVSGPKKTTKKKK